MLSFARRCPFVSGLAIALATTSTGSIARAQTGPSRSTVVHAAWGSPRIDPRIASLIGHRTRFGTTLPAFRRSPRFERDGTLPVVIRFDASPSPTEITALTRGGVAFQRGAHPFFSGAYGARTDEHGLTALDADPNVARVEIDLPLASPRPLERSAIETGIADARRELLRRDGTALDGHGVVIGDVDTGSFIFHPAFFRADAGSYPWIDLNHNGRFDPDVDAIDLDENGELASEETVRVLNATIFDAYGNPLPGMNSGAFRPERDWIYLDTDGNGERDYGAQFDDSVPAFGEPLFVLDDANHDGIAQASEHFLRLGTNKYRAILGTTEYVRGHVGADALVNSWDSFEDVSHGTGVGGILVGGVPGVSRLLGLAPNAEMLLCDDATVGESTGTTGCLQWEMDQGANVLLTEYAPYAYVTLDGSSEEELLLDAALDHDVVPVSPAGNLADGHKHQRLHLVPGDNDIVAGTDDSFTGSRLVQISLHHRTANRDASLSVVLPDQRVLTLPANSPMGSTLGGGYVGYTMQRLTPRGTSERHALVYRGSGLPAGAWTIRIHVDDGGPLDADLFVADDRTSWGGGFTLEGNDAASSLCHPATSDRTLAVAAYVLHGEGAYGPWGSMGDLAGYSSHGPPIDGVDGIDIAAPDNPMSTTSISDRAPYASYWPFGGTSGAGPHVAASAALLRQLYPTESASALRERLVSHARADATTTAEGPTLWGAGRLDLAAAAAIDRNATGTAPTVTIDAPDTVLIGSTFEVTAHVTDNSAPAEMRARWDLDSDGTYETDWAPLAPRQVTANTAGFRDVRVEVLDAEGLTAGNTARVVVARSIPMNRDGGVALRSVEASGGCSCGIHRSNVRPPWPRMALVMAALALHAARRRGRVAASKLHASRTGIPRDC